MNCCGENCKCEERKFSLTGDSNSLYYVNDSENYRSIKLIEEVNGADVALELTSVDAEGNHTLLEKFLGKKVELSIRIVEE